MPLLVSIPYHLSASPGAEGDATLYTVPDAMTLILNKIQIHFPSGTAGELELSFYRGMEKVAPTERVYTGDDVLWIIDVKIVFRSGSNVTLHYKNTNTTTAREAYLILGGELE